MFWNTSGDSSSTGRIESVDRGHILDLIKNLTSRVILLCVFYLAGAILKFCDNFRKILGHPIHFESHSMFSVNVILYSTITTLIIVSSCVQVYQSH